MQQTHLQDWKHLKRVRERERERETQTSLQARDTTARDCLVLLLLMRRGRSGVVLLGTVMI